MLFSNPKSVSLLRIICWSTSNHVWDNVWSGPRHADGDLLIPLVIFIMSISLMMTDDFNESFTKSKIPHNYLSYTGFL